MQFGLLSQPDQEGNPFLSAVQFYGVGLIEETLEQLEHAEEIGFDSVWLAERHFSNSSLISDAMVLAAHAAARTRRVRIGVADRALPLHHPILLAEQAATVDLLSRGRLDIGVGAGDDAHEFAGLGIDLGERHGRFNESLDVLLKALTLDSFGYEGRFFHIPRIRTYPRPMQRPRPPIFVTTSSDETLVAAAVHGLPIILNDCFMPLEKVAERLRLYQAALHEAGAPPVTIGHLTRRSWVMRFVHLQNFNGAARDKLGAAIAARFAADGRNVQGHLPAPSAEESGSAETATPLSEEALQDLWERAFVIGDAEECARKIQQLRQVGVEAVLCRMAFGSLGHDTVLRSMEQFASQVMPRFPDMPQALLA